MRISDWSSDVCSSDLPVLESSRAAPSRYGRIRALYFVVAAQSDTGMWRILWCPPFPYGPATGSLKHPTHPEILPGLPNGAADIAKRAEAELRYSGYVGKSFHPDIAVNIGAGDPRRDTRSQYQRRRKNGG